MGYKHVELHCHTHHSDGTFTVKQLLDEAKRLKMSGIAITDHNTFSAFYDDEIKTADELCLLKGIEWTTYFGHVLVLDCEKIVDWRLATIDNIDEYFDEIKRYNGLIGIAHPYQLGSPFCTGCFFDFNVQNWNNVDYIEVWSRESPVNAHKNKEAYKLWMRKLNLGYKIAATSGMDWHGYEPETNDFARTYLDIEGDITPSKMKSALQNGKSYVTLGPSFDFIGVNLGDEISSDRLKLTLNIKNNPEKEKAVAKTIKVINNSNCVLEVNLEANLVDIDVSVEKGFVVFEIHGDYIDESDKLIAFSSPVYIV